MNFTKIMKELQSPEFNPPRSGKDLSHRKVFTFNAGELLPVLCEEILPKDYFEVDVASLVRTFALQTAAFVRAKICLDFFFVPHTAVWRNYDKFYYQRNDNYSSMRGGSAFEPNISWGTLIEYINHGAPVGSGDFDTVDARKRLLSLLGYPTASGSQYVELYSRSFTALPLFAYQRIYNLWYRNAWRDEPNDYDINSMSADSYMCEDYQSSLVSPDGINRYDYGNPAGDDHSQHDQYRLCAMRYHQWPSDLFMGSLPNSQFGNVSSVDATLNKFHLSSISTVPFLVSTPTASDGSDVAFRFGGTVGDGGVVSGSSPASSSSSGVSGSSSFDVLALRKALAMQKWKEYNMRAGWKAGKQARAMFGVDTPMDRKHDIDYLGGFHFPLMVDEVTQTTPTDSSPLGDLGGKAIGVGNMREKIKFSSGERSGYLFCILYALPDSEYDAVGIDKQLIRSEPFDHYNPAFENLGLEPVHKFELNAQGNPAVFDNIIGYVPRYHEYKTRVDKVYGRFASGDLRPWVAPRVDLESIANSGTIPTRYFYVSPIVFKNLFYAIPDGSADTDQMMCNLNFDIKAVRAMSDLGLPTL